MLLLEKALHLYKKVQMHIHSQLGNDICIAAVLGYDSVHSTLRFDFVATGLVERLNKYKVKWLLDLSDIVSG